MSQLSLFETFQEEEKIKQSHEYYTEFRKEYLTEGRVIVWFSAGATSAIAAKLTVMKYKDSDKEVCVVYCDTGGEHETNKQFLKDVEAWIDHPILVVKNPKYEDHWEVFKKERYIAGVGGAKCTTVLKKKMRQKFEDVGADIQVFGYSVEEEKRANRFRQNNPEVYLECPLIDRGIDKVNCLAILKESQIALPYMYHSQKSGAPYDHNNCLGCPKGGAGYWNKIRIDFPDAFEKMCKMEEHLNTKILKVRGERTWLRDLPVGYGRFRDEKPIECGLSCGSVLDQIVDEEKENMK